MADQLLLPPAEDGNGNRLAAAIAYFYLTGTTTPVTVYQSDGVTAIGTSVTADANGVFQQVFTTSGSAIKINVTTALGAAVPGYPVDPVIRVAGTNSQAAQVSYAPSVEIPETDVQAAIENVQAQVVEGRGYTYATYLATSSGTAFDFTGIPSWASEIVVLLNGVSLSGTDDLRVQIGSASGIEITGYSASASMIDASSLTSSDYTASFGIPAGNTGAFTTGTVFLTRFDTTTNQWHCSFTLKRGTGVLTIGAGIKTTPGALDRVRLTRSGSNTFDAGFVNVGWR